MSHGAPGSHSCLGTQVCPGLSGGVSQSHTAPGSCPRPFLGSTGPHCPHPLGPGPVASWIPFIKTGCGGRGSLTCPECAQRPAARRWKLPPRRADERTEQEGSPGREGPQQPRSCRPPVRALPPQPHLSIGKADPSPSNPTVYTCHSAPGAPREGVPTSPPAPFWTWTPLLGPKKLKCSNLFFPPTTAPGLCPTQSPGRPPGLEVSPHAHLRVRALHKHFLTPRL